MSALAALLLGLAPAPASGELERVRTELSAAELAWRRALPELPPPLRGWRAPLLGEPPLGWDAPGEDAPQGLRRAASLVQRTLAREGLVATTARVTHLLASADDRREQSPDARLAELAATGLPVDLCALWRFDDEPEPDGGDDARAAAFVARLWNAAEAGASEEELVALAGSARFGARAPEPPFRAAAECGEAPIELVRAQLSRADPWLGPEDGGNLDLVRQVAAALPEAQLVLSTGEAHADALERELERWPPRNARRVLCVEPLAVSQWAQDNAEPGWIAGPQAQARPALLVPRYASRGERGAHAPGESFLVESLARAGFAVVRSRLLFQGGNVLVVHDPQAGERLAVLGEAEVVRNLALGLSLEQVLEELRAELAVDRCMVLPAVAFHVDQELSFRVVEGALVAFVHDDAAGVTRVLELALDALERAGRVDPGRARAARETQPAREGALAPAALVALVREALDEAALEPGLWPRSLAQRFSSGAQDPGEANLDLVLIALEQAASAEPERVAAAEPFEAALLRSWARARADRARVVEALGARGWRVVAVPGLPGEHGLDYLNALHAPRRTLVPAYGGFWEPLDRAAHAVWRAALGGEVELVPVRAAESQRRQGALHCSIALHPRAPG